MVMVILVPPDSEFNANPGGGVTVHDPIFAGLSDVVKRKLDRTNTPFVSSTEDTVPATRRVEVTPAFARMSSDEPDLELFTIAVAAIAAMMRAMLIPT